MDNKSSGAQGWKVIVEIDVRAERDEGPSLAQRLANAGGNLGLPPALVERVNAAVAQAGLNRCKTHDRDEHSIVSVLARPAAAGLPGQNWGFFLIHNGSEGPSRHRIEVYLYHDGEIA